MWKKCLTLNWEYVKLTKSLRERHSNPAKPIAAKSEISLWTLIIKQWNNPENSMNFHSKNKANWNSLDLRNSKTSKDERNEPLLFRNKMPESSSEKGKNLINQVEHFNMRVWSWLRMNAGGVLNTCKSNEALENESSEEFSFDLVADGWVTRG